jgi:geranylgeranyl pyrophosphate synthase
MLEQSTQSVIAQLGYESEMAQLRERIARWIDECSEELREALQWQFLTGSKYFRPLTIFSCYRAMHEGPIPERIMQSALVIELFHNVSLIIDDIVDRSPTRRGRATMHTKFGELSALMTSGYIVAEGYLQLKDDLTGVALFSELLKRLGVAECLQWRLRRQPLGVEDWRKIAGEDTGSMFEVCACLGDRSGRLRKFGGLLGLLYHGCDEGAGRTRWRWRGRLARWHPYATRSAGNPRSRSGEDILRPRRRQFDRTEQATYRGAARSGGLS